MNTIIIDACESSYRHHSLLCHQKTTINASTSTCTMNKCCVLVDGIGDPFKISMPVARTHIFVTCNVTCELLPSCFPKPNPSANPNLVEYAKTHSSLKPLTGVLDALRVGTNRNHARIAHPFL